MPWPFKESTTRSAVGVARPLRVAYLVDPNRTDSEVLSAIFSEAYGRWGGRHTLIVPADGVVDPQYGDWLRRFDADLIYSYVDLTDDEVARLHRTLAPADLTRHRPIGINSASVVPELDIDGLRSISLCPSLRLSRGLVGDGPVPCQLINVSFNTIYQFVETNFGALNRSFKTTFPAYPEAYSTVELTTPSMLKDPYRLKRDDITYVSDEYELLELVSKSRTILGLVHLSTMRAPRLDVPYQQRRSGVDIVVGDSFEDRLLFWNLHHRHQLMYWGDIAVLSLTETDILSSDRMQAVGKLIRARSWSDGGNQQRVELISASVPKEVLEKGASLINDGWILTTCRNADHALSIPTFQSTSTWTWHLAIAKPKPARTEFSSHRINVPLASPSQFESIELPPWLAGGSWMVDLNIDRIVDHSRFANTTEKFCFPRRLRLDLATHWQFGESPHPVKRRPILDGSLSFLLSADTDHLLLHLPTDEAAFETALTTRFEWRAFDRSTGRQLGGPERLGRVAYSSKARYLIGLIERFEALGDAVAVLLHPYWVEIFNALGAANTDSQNIGLRDELLSRLRKITGQQGDTLSFKGKDQLQKFAAAALAAARRAPRTNPVMSYEQLRDRWKENWADEARARGEEAFDENISPRLPELDASIQLLCAYRLLYQGYEWRCHRCLSKNWTGIDGLRTHLNCPVCSVDQYTPVSTTWHFRADESLITTYRDHGIGAVIRALDTLSQMARQSFAFFPSVDLWIESNKGSRRDCEVDLLAVVDGRVWLCEVTRSATLAMPELEKLALAISKIRPDVVALFFDNSDTSRGKKAATDLKAMVPSDVEVRVQSFREPWNNAMDFLPR